MILKIWQGVIYPILIYLIGNVIAMVVKEVAPKYVDLTMALGIGSVFTFIILYLYAKRNKRLKANLCFRDEKKIDIRRLIYIIPIAFSFAILYNVVIDITKLSEIFPAGADVSETLFSSNYIVAIIVVVVIVPIVEEVLFRGYIYKSISGYGGKVVASIVSAVLFAIAHGNVTQGIYAFLCTFLFIYIYESFDNILASMFAHIIANLSAILFGATEVFYDVMPFMHEILLIIVCIAIFIMGIYRFNNLYIDRSEV